MRKKSRRGLRRTRPNRWQRFTWSILGAGLCLGALTLGTVWSLHGSPLAAIQPFQRPFGGQPRANILILGLDDGQGGRGRSDSMLLVHVDTTTRRLTALSIPRDTRVPLGDGRFGKINAAHARGGPAEAVRAVAELTGLPVDYTVSTNFAGFSRLVDLAGGIDLDVDRAMDYDDNWGQLHIHLKPGFQHLDGERAIQYVRYRKANAHEGDGSDISRIARQQRFIQALAARCLGGDNLLRLPELLQEGRRQVQTNLAASDLLYLSELAKENGAARLKLLTVPGKTAMIGGQSYWLASGSDIADAVRQLVGGETLGGAPVRVAVLNASRRRGLGRQVAGELKRRGYPVAMVATSDAESDTSEVIAPEPCRAGAEAIASCLACDCAIGDPAPAQVHDAQITVVVGKDYRVNDSAPQRG